jgi:ADP-ribosylglycohydrolase
MDLERGNAVHDPLNAYDLVHDELAQRRESGFDVAQLEHRCSAVDPADREGLEGLYADLIDAPRASGWNYEEPEALQDILATLPLDPQRQSVGDGELGDKILGGWLGRVAGCNLGKPVEWGDHWTTSRIREYLEQAGAWPLRDYIPVLEPMPPQFELNASWPETTRGRIDGSARDDDIDYAILGLHLIESHGRALTPALVAESWLSLLPVLQVFTAERAAYINLVNRVPIGLVRSTRNPYREWVGALIRGDAFGWTNPGDPRAAATAAYQDASLSHMGNGVYGELWSAALIAGAFGSRTIREAFERSLDSVPPRSRLAEALTTVRDLRDASLTWDAAISEIQSRWGRYSWVHTVNNAAIIAAGLLWGEEDYTTTVGLTVQGGWDTDSNAATAGSVAGVVLGARRLPRNFTEPLDDRTRSAIFGYDNSRISDLATRTVRLATAGVR